MAGSPDPGRSVGGLERFWGEQRAQSWVSSGGAGWWGDWHLAPEGRRTESGGSYGWAQPCGEGCKVLDTSEGLRSGARGTPAGRPRADRSARSVAEADKSIRPGDRRGDFFPHGGWLAGRGVQRHPESLPAPNAPRLPGLPRPRAPHPRASHLAAPRVSPSAAPPARSRSRSLSPFSPPLSSCTPLSPLSFSLSPSAPEDSLSLRSPPWNADSSSEFGSDPARPDCLAPQLQSLGHRFFIWSGVLLRAPPSRPA